MLTLDRVSSIIEDHRANVANAIGKRGGLSPENIARVHAAANKAKRANALAAYADIIGPMRELRRSGMTLAAIANTLNAEGHRTRRGCLWDAANVKRIIESYA
jgi:hypothetical protein